MHILEIVSFLPPYGGYFAIEQACALREAGQEVRMLYVQQLGITIYPKEYFTARYDRWSKTLTNNQGTEIEVYQANFRAIPKTIKPNADRYCKITREMFADYIKRYGKPDLLHAHCAKWAGIAAMQIGKEYSIPYFVTEHFSSGCYFDFGEGWSHDQWARERIIACFSNARSVIPVAEELVADLQPLFGTHYQHHAISNIVDTDFFIFQPRATHHPFRLCCLAVANGGMFDIKGYDILAQAFSKTEGSELHIAGRSTDTDKFKQRFEKYYGRPIDSRVILHGDLHREGVRSLLYQCDALVLASRSEVQPLVLLEAMSTGIPVVSTEVMPQAIRIEGACIVVEKDNADALRKGIEKVKELAPTVKISEAVKEIASKQRVAAQLIALFQG